MTKAENIKATNKMAGLANALKMNRMSMKANSSAKGINTQVNTLKKVI